MNYVIGKWVPQCCLLLAALAIVIFLFMASCSSVEVPLPLSKLVAL